MDPEEKIMLKRALDLSEENNQMLKKLVRSMRWGRLIRAVYWGILIAISVGSFYYAQPYINDVIKAYGSARDSLNNLGGIMKPN
jgi:hypothetical protein